MDLGKCIRDSFAPLPLLFHLILIFGRVLCGCLQELRTEVCVAFCLAVGRYGTFRYSGAAKTRLASSSSTAGSCRSVDAWLHKAVARLPLSLLLVEIMDRSNS